MAKAQQNRGGGQQQQYGNNQAMSLGQRLDYVLGRLHDRKEEIAAVLPPDIDYDAFHATINQALRNDPSLLDCTGPSIVNACVKSAYDGLRIDGKEAALVAHRVNVAPRGATAVWESHAEYFPMVRGLIKKILMGGRVVSMEVEAIHQNDEYEIQRGTNPFVHHRPMLVGDRGPRIAYYSVATLRDGGHSVEFMTQADVDDVKAEAKTKFVWDRWGGEMGKKSVIRRHEKKLPSGREFIDIEAKTLFPQFDRTTPHPQLAAPTPAPPRPQRGQITQRDDTNGTAMDFGSQPIDEREPVTVEAKAKPAQQEQRHDAAREQKQEQGAQVELPADGAEWSMWATEVRAKLAKVKSVDAANALWASERGVIEQFADRRKLEQEFTDRIADLASGGDDGAGAGDAENDTQHGAK